LLLRTPEGLACGMFFALIKNSQRRKEKQQRQREAAKWLTRLVEIVADAQDGTQRILEGDEAVEAIIRQWEADETG
jgi:hypothetical protein